MKKILVITLFYLLCTHTHGQSRFNKIYRLFTVDSTGQQAATTFYSMRVVNNNIYTAGISIRIVDNVVTNSGIFSSFDMAGNMLKNTYFGIQPTNSDFDNDVILVEPNNTFALIGYNYDYTSNFVKVDKEGNILFKKIFPHIDTSIYLGRSANFVKIGNKYAFATYISRPTVSKSMVHFTDTMGNTKRMVEFNTTERVSHSNQIIKNKNNNLVLCSFHTSKSSTDTNYVYFSELREIDTAGNTLWNYYTPRNRYVYFKKVIELANGNYLVGGDEEVSDIVVVGSYAARTNTIGYPYLAEINPQRGLVWEKRFILKSRLFEFKLLKDSSMILSCAYDDGISNTTSRLIKLSKNKDSLYSRNFRATSITSGNILHIPSQIEELDNGDLVIGGWAQDLKNRTLSVTSGQWGWLVRTDSLGCSLQPSSCRTPTKDIKEYPLSIIAYPNPTSGSLTIDFDIPTAFKAATFSLIDITGREVFNQKIDNGQKQVIWQTEQLNQGLYFIILTIDNQSIKQTKVSIQK